MLSVTHRALPAGEATSAAFVGEGWAVLLTQAPEMTIDAGEHEGTGALFDGIQRRVEAVEAPKTVTAVSLTVVTWRGGGFEAWSVGGHRLVVVPGEGSVETRSVEDALLTTYREAGLLAQLGQRARGFEAALEVAIAIGEPSSFDRERIRRVASEGGEGALVVLDLELRVAAFPLAWRLDPAEALSAEAFWAAIDGAKAGSYLALAGAERGAR